MYDMKHDNEAPDNNSEVVLKPESREIIPKVPRLKTPVLDSAGKPVNYRIRDFGPLAGVMIDFAGKMIGQMRYSIKKDHIYIHRMDNYTCNQEKPFKGVGTLLFEYAFRMSIKCGHNGRLELDAIEAAPAAYYKMGFRKKCSAAIWMGGHISEYLSAPNAEEKNRKKDKILEDSFYLSLKENAAENLKKDLADISFDEAITHGLTDALTDNRNKEFENFLAKNSKVTNWDCYSLYMQGMMYLPAESLALLKRKFLDTKAPIGSLFAWNSEYAKKTLKIPALLDLVSKGKLSPANAVEIEYKMDATDPRLEILLSPTGLKMMKRNHISGWYIGVYFFNLDYVKAIISPESLNAFEKSFITINQLVNLQIGIGTQLLSKYGLQALYDGEIMISESGYSVQDKNGNSFHDTEVFKTFLQEVHDAREKMRAENNDPNASSCLTQ